MTAYFTTEGRVVRVTKSPLDPGLRRKGVRLSLDHDVILGTVIKDDDGWFYATLTDGSYTAGSSRRKSAIDKAIQAHKNLRR